MPTAVLDGIETHFEVVGEGSPLLMFSPGGFNSVLDNWDSLGVYRRIQLVANLQEHFRCIMFDRRESGSSGGRLERIAWTDYVAQGRSLLDFLGIERAHLIGGCVGCSIAAAFAVTHPDRVDRMVLYAPAGGPRYRMSSQARFDQHLAFVRDQGLSEVVALARSHDDGFAQDPRVGPWVSVLRGDPAFAARYEVQDPDSYLVMVTGMRRLLFDRDTVPGVEPEDLMLLEVPSLVVPGEDRSHAPSAARYLQECLPQATYWDIPVAEQNDTVVPQRIKSFLIGD